MLPHIGFWNIHEVPSDTSIILAETELLKPLGVGLVLLYAARIDSITRSQQSHSDELLALATEQGLSFYLGFSTTFRGSSLIAIGQVLEGLTLPAQELAAVRASGQMFGTPRLLMELARGNAKLGRTLEGLSHLAEAAQIIETTEQRAGGAELHRFAKLSELSTATSLARLRRDQGKCAEARDLLAPVYGWFTEGFDTPVPQDAKALLVELA